MFPVETHMLIWNPTLHKLVRGFFWLLLVILIVFFCALGVSKVSAEDNTPNTDNTLESVTDEPPQELPTLPELRVQEYLTNPADVATAGVICNPYGYNIFQPVRPRGQSTYIPWPTGVQGKFVSGVVPRFAAGGRDIKWKTGSNPDSGAMFPEPGKINLELFWEVTERCHDNNWDYQFQLYWGAYAPRWLKSKGIKFISYDGGPAPAIAPIPWDKVYLQEFNRCIEMLSHAESSPGIRFIDDPLCTVIHMTGVQQFSPEMHFSNELKSLPNFDANIRFAFREVFKIWKLYFPRKRLCLNLFVLKNENLMRQVGEDFISIVGKEQACFQINHWNAKASLSGDRPYKYLLELNKRGFVCMLEQTMPSTNPRMGGTFDQTLKRITESKSAAGIIYFNDMVRIKAPWPGVDIRTDAQKNFRKENLKRIERLRASKHLLMNPELIGQN